MAGLLDLQGNTYGGLLSPDVQQQAAMRGLIGTMLGIGQASAPSPVPNNFLGALSAGGQAGINAYDNYEQNALKKGLLGLQVAQIQENIDRQRQAQQFMQSLPQGPVRDRLQLALLLGDKSVPSVLGPQSATSPGTYRTLSGDLANVGNLGAISNANAAESYGTKVGEFPAAAALENLKTANNIEESYNKFYPIPYQAGGDVMRIGNPNANQTLQRLIAPPGPLMLGAPPGATVSGGSGTAAGPRGGAGSDTLENPAPRQQMAQSSMPTATPTFGASKNAPGLQPGALEEGVGKFGAKVLEEAHADATSARAGLANVAQMRAAMANGMRMGMGAEFTNDILARGLEALGIKPDAIKEYLGADPSNARAFSSASNQLVLAVLGGKLGAQISDSDRKFVTDTVAQLRDTPEAAVKLLSWAEWKLQGRIDRYDEMAGAFFDKKVNPAQFDREFLKRPVQPPEELLQAGYGQSTRVMKPTNEAAKTVVDPLANAGAMPKVPEGVPFGSQQIGTYQGKPVWVAPNGKRYVVQ